VGGEFVSDLVSRAGRGAFNRGKEPSGGEKSGGGEGISKSVARLGKPRKSLPQLRRGKETIYAGIRETAARYHCPNVKSEVRYCRRSPPQKTTEVQFY